MEGHDIKKENNSEATGDKSAMNVDFSYKSGEESMQRSQN